MQEIDKYKRQWGKIVNKLYVENERDEFNYIPIKKLEREINIFEKNIIRKQRDITITLELTDFHTKEEVKEELECFLEYLNEMIEYLKNFTNIKPKTKQGYYNYLKNAMGFL